MSLFGGATNPYDEIVVKATDENLTSENWELIINLVDKVTEEGEQGSRNVVGAILKRLAHRNPNVQLYSLSLAESLSKNCGKQLHAEIASRAFTQGLEKLITDRTTHDKVRRKALQLIGMWAQEWESDPSLGMMEECYNALRAKNYSFNAPDEPPPPEVDDEVRRREEEELQRALEISMTDKGGRQQWAQYSLASSSSAGASSSGGQSSHAGASSSGPSSSAVRADAAPSYSGGYTPNATSSAQSYSQPTPASSTPAPITVDHPTPSPTATPGAAPSMSGPVTRVRALHTFEPSEPGELAFDRGDIIKVVDRGYKDWWRGQLKGRTGIFPVNYVEPLPEPTAAELAAEAQQEANVFSQVANVDRLLELLRQMDPVKDNLADNEEIQELYRSCMALRPKIVKLIDKYSQKRADLVAMNESFVKARTIFDRMMEESLSRHSGYYDARPVYGPAQGSYQMRPDSRATYGPGGQWNPAGAYDPQAYNYPPPAEAYTPPADGQFARPQMAHQGSYAPGGPPPQQHQPGPYPQQYPSPGHRASFHLPAGQQPMSPQPHTDAHQPQQPGPAPHPYQAQAGPEPAAQQPAPQAQVQQQQAEPQQAAGATPLMQGPPYTFDPTATYPDPNAQAWAQYYAAGGDDPTGSVYFISVPGVKPPPSSQAGSPTHAAGAQVQPLTQAQTSQTSLTSPQGGTYEQQQGLPPSAHMQPQGQAIQQQQQAVTDPARQNSLPDPYDAATHEQRQGSLPNPYGAIPYGQSPYPPEQQQLPPQDAYNVQGLQTQLAGMHVGDAQSQPAHA